MGVPVSQMWTVASYVLKQRIRGRKHYPLVLMLEPLFRCNLACAGCGKIQFPADILKKNLSPAECFTAIDECGAPIVSIPGGEPLLHPQIHEIVDGLIARKKYIYLCTNAILLEQHLEKFKPSKYLTFSIHMDGPREEHDEAVCREGVFDVAISAIKAAVERGFRVTTNTTLFNTADPAKVREMFDILTELGVEGMMLSPGYQYEKAPDQEHFLLRDQTIGLFRRTFANAKKRWHFNQSPLFLEFLKGRWDLECTPWGNPTYNVFGWQKPCYLVDEGHVETFQELIETTEWANYGRASGNSKCQNCMVHSGYEPSAVNDTFGSLKGFLKTAQLTMFGSKTMPGDETAPLAPRSRTSPAESELVSLETNFSQPEESPAETNATT
ncbi:MAG: adenosyl-hopene transferase HpnH [Planctomycetaceae bacterium]|jgi:hopanoid biosynthesis associated radical SAM protein HpnH|nr:adenosyl-hopene transferase HpnH [Planctomycetaceae bacterium]